MSDSPQQSNSVNGGVPPPTPPAPTIAEQRKKLTDLATRIAELLKQGEEAQRVGDEFYAKHNLQPGDGKRALIAGGGNKKSRAAMSRFLHELETMDEKLRKRADLPEGTPERSAGARVAASKLRI